jgi:hypothetical protein
MEEDILREQEKAAEKAEQAELPPPPHAPPVDPATLQHKDHQHTGMRGTYVASAEAVSALLPVVKAEVDRRQVLLNRERVIVDRERERERWEKIVEAEGGAGDHSWRRR